MTMPATTLALWDAFCREQAILERGVPLFDCAEDGSAVVHSYGSDGRLILRRSSAMEALTIAEVERVIADFHSGVGEWDGLLYMMFREDNNRVVPLYIGRTAKFGRNSNLSANLANIRTNLGMFARWGSNYAYHIGNLSAVVCNGHGTSKMTPKYRRWARRLFETVPCVRPKQRFNIRFWATAWGPKSVSIWPASGSASLKVEESRLIAVGRELFSADLLNEAP
jgi:hypothetical protein